MPKTKIAVALQVATTWKTLHPQNRRDVKAAILGLASGKGNIRALERELEGLHRLAVGRFRLIYRYTPDGAIRCFYLAPRNIVYDALRARPDLWDS